MLRSLKVVGVVALTLGVPSVALAGGSSSGQLQAGAAANNGGGNYETSVTVDTAPLNSKCPAVMKIHGTTTLLAPDGKHFSATAYFQVGNQATNKVALDFSKKTTVTWEADWHDPDIGAIFQSGIVAMISDYTGGTSQEVVAYQGSFQVGCGMSIPGSKPTIPAAVTLTPNICTDYDPNKLQVSINPSALMTTGAFAGSLYMGNPADVLFVNGIARHYKSMCSIGASQFYWFEGEGNKTEPYWGKCTSYDNSNVTVTNDATGWVVRAGEKEMFRVGLEADARTLGNAVKHRTNSCTIGEGSEPAVHVLHYLR